MQKQLKKPDKLDKYRSHLLEGAELPPEGVEMLARYRKAHGLLCLGFSKNQVLATLEKEYDLSQPQLYAIVRESIQLYGSIEEVDKKGLRVIATENYKLLANLARKNGDIGNAIRATELSDKLQGLFEAEKSVLDPRAFLIPVPMAFTTDGAVYIAQQKEETQETEDTEYEEVNEPDDDEPLQQL